MAKSLRNEKVTQRNGAKASGRLNRRGATALETENKAINWSGWKAYLPAKRKVMAVALFLCFATSGTYLALLFNGKAGMPLGNISVGGDLVYSNRGAITEVISSHVERGFFGIDLGDVKQELEALPWVYKARVSREWPDKLVVHVEEERPIALWGDAHVVNHQGELFLPEQGEKPKDLPLLTGPEGRELAVMRQYELLSHLFGEMGLRIHEFAMDSRGAAEVQLGSGSRVKLGAENVIEKMQRFSTTYSVELGQKMDRIDVIDLRYTNGLSVKWKQQETDKKNDQVGA